MAGVINDSLNAYMYVQNILPEYFSKFLNLFLLIVFVLVYVIFIWKLHKFVSKKNIISLNLKQYNKSDHPFFEKVFAGGFYLIEYILILPFLVFLWFSVFTTFLILLGQNSSPGAVILLSATVIAVIRMTAYYDETLSKDIAKLLPFTLLAIALSTPDILQFDIIVEKLIEIPTLISDITIYLGFIIILEIILRTFDFFLAILGLEDETIED